MQVAAVDALTINEAAETTGWSARMLRYIESIGLVEPARSGSGYRLYGPPELQRLSTLRELLDERELDLGEVGFALRLGRDPRLREAIEQWLAAEPARPEHVSAEDWLRFEQEKHERLLVASKPTAKNHSLTTTMEIV
jgi:DNA-binding transcriptional MerR regulator